MSLHIVLHEPEIPPNTGNIARTCVATNTELHLVHPLGFDVDMKTAKRAGLDYWENCVVHHYDSMDDFFMRNPGAHFFLIETGGTTLYTEADFADVTQDIYLIFGKETAGLPKELLAQYSERILEIPQTDKVRSLNLSNAVAIVLFEALRQRKFLDI